MPESLKAHYTGSAAKALLVAPVLAAVPSLGHYVSRIVNAYIAAYAERAQHGASDRLDLLGEHLLSLLTVGAMRQYLITLVLTAAGTALLLAPMVALFLYRRWPTGLLKGAAGVLGLMPWAAQTLEILWIGVDGPPLTGLVAILGGLCNGVIPLLAVILFLRILQPRTVFSREDLDLDEAARERMPFLAAASRSGRENAERR